MSVVTSVFCVLACVFQLAYTQCIGAYPNAVNGPPPFGPVGAPYGPLPLEGPGLGPMPGSYGGAGVGDVNVVGELPVAGTTLVAGEVPILGAVSFNGLIPAAGVVGVSGSCSCGARFEAPFVY